MITIAILKYGTIEHVVRSNVCQDRFYWCIAYSGMVAPTLALKHIKQTIKLAEEDLINMDNTVGIPNEAISASIVYDYSFI